MAILSSSSQTEIFSKHRAPFFTGTDYPYWKARMTWFLQSTDLNVWDVIEDDPTFPTKLVDGVLVPKPKKEWNEFDRRNFPSHFLSFYFSSLFSFLCIIPQIFREPNITMMFYKTNSSM